MVSMAVGDGTTSSAGRLLPRRAPGARRPTGSARCGSGSTTTGRALTDYVEELTKELHLYVVNEDLTVFRHLHPTMAEDGTWAGPAVVPAAGDYRVIAEFVGRDEGGNGDHVVLGDTRAPAG